MHPSSATQPESCSPQRPMHHAVQRGMRTHGEATGELRLKDVLDTAAKYVTPFNGVEALDKGRTVTTFVESIEMVMGNILPHASPHRLMLVQMCLKESALQWMDNTLLNLQEEARAASPPRDLAVYPLSWDSEVRQKFIEAFIGLDMVEMWLAQMAALRLGAETTKTPVELNIKFDALARHVFRRRTANGDQDMMLAVQYRDIVAASDFQMYKTIMRSDRPQHAERVESSAG